MTGKEPQVNWKAQLRRVLMEFFDESELKVICFDLGIDYENISRDTKIETVIQIIEYCIRVDRVDELIALCSQHRPNVPWDEIAEAARVWSRERDKPSAMPRA
jgi:hypothetical protein